MKKLISIAASITVFFILNYKKIKGNFKIKYLSKKEDRDYDILNKISIAEKIIDGDESYVNDDGSIDYNKNEGFTLGSFLYSHNRLLSLEGAPKRIGMIKAYESFAE